MQAPSYAEGPSKRSHGPGVHCPRGAVLVPLLAAVACVGNIGAGEAAPDSPEPRGPGSSAPAAGAPPSDVPASVPPGLNAPTPVPQRMGLGRGPTGISRLSHAELSATLRSLLGVDLGADLSLLPADSRRPFDNDYTLQTPSRALVEGWSAVVERVAARALASTAQRQALITCTPTGPGDSACLRTFAERIGLRLLRRPLAPAELDELAAFSQQSKIRGDFFVGVSLVLRTLLSDIEFLYRIEIGEPVKGSPGVVRLTDFEVASRLAFLLWGQAPDDKLLMDAAAGMLRTTDGLRLAATRLLADERGTTRLLRFHALWLGYEELPFQTALAASARRETDALVRRYVIDQKKPWNDLFSATETFIDGTLATHYGLPAPANGTAAWVPQNTGDRRGLLGNAALLANGVKNGETSPTLRGKFVRERLLCTVVPPPPPNVNNAPPETGGGKNCKIDRYAAHRTDPSCAGCHALMDGTGFGLENYDAQGRYRATDDGRKDCPIDGQGRVGDVAFKGISGLSEIVQKSDRLLPCLIQHLYQFTLGREVGSGDAPALAELQRDFQTRNGVLPSLVLDVVGDDSFLYRTLEAP